MPAKIFKLRSERKSNTILYIKEENGSIVNDSYPIRGSGRLDSNHTVWSHLPLDVILINIINADEYPREATLSG